MAVPGAMSPSSPESNLAPYLRSDSRLSADGYGALLVAAIGMLVAAHSRPFVRRSAVELREVSSAGLPHLFNAPPPTSHYLTCAPRPE